MYTTSSTQNVRSGVPVSYGFTINGTEIESPYGGFYIPLDRLYSVSPTSCKAEPLEGKFSVSELSCSFVDIDARLWNAFGRGTSNLDVPFSATVYIGGSMGYTTYNPGNMPRITKLGTYVAETYTLHSGNVYEVSRENRITTISSRNKMAKVDDLEWRFPVYGTKQSPTQFLGTNVFFTGNLLTQFPDAFFEQENDGFKAYVYVGDTTQPSAYGTLSGRGSLGLLDSKGYVFAGTQFFYDYTRYLYDGTYLGTHEGSLVGTITPTTPTETIQEYSDRAKMHGFETYDDAANAVIADNDGTRTPIGKTRFKPIGEVPSYFAGSQFVFQQNYTLEESPAILWNEMLTGNCVTPYFSGTDIDSTAYGSAVRVTAYQTYKQLIDPKGGKVLPFLKSLLEPLQARFSVGHTNKLRMHIFGPRTLADASGSVAQEEVLRSSASANVDDKINHITLTYGYDTGVGSYTKKIELRGTNWSNTNDYPYNFESNWIQNDNDARITVQRLLRSYSSGIPKYEVDVPLSKMGVDIGTMLVVTDADMAYSDAPFEVTSWSKDLDKGRKIKLTLSDARALYGVRGYGRWEDGTTKEEAVTGTSTFGWGTNGTTPGINTSVYGQRFVWW